MHAMRLRNGPCGFYDQVQGQGHQTQTNGHAPPASPRVVLIGHKNHDTRHNQQRRQPTQIKRKHQSHQAGAHIRTQHHDQCGRGQEDALPHKRAHDQAGGRTGLQQTAHPHTRYKCPQGVFNATGQHFSQRCAQNSQDAGTHSVRTPHQQCNCGQQVQEVVHAVKPKAWNKF